MTFGLALAIIAATALVRVVAGQLNPSDIVAVESRANANGLTYAIRSVCILVAEEERELGLVRVVGISEAVKDYADYSNSDVLSLLAAVINFGETCIVNVLFRNHQVDVQSVIFLSRKQCELLGIRLPETQKKEPRQRERLAMARYCYQSRRNRNIGCQRLSYVSDNGSQAEDIRSTIAVETETSAADFVSVTSQKRYHQPWSLVHLQLSAKQLTVLFCGTLALCICLLGVLVGRQHSNPNQHSRYEVGRSDNQSPVSGIQRVQPQAKALRAGAWQQGWLRLLASSLLMLGGFGGIAVGWSIVLHEHDAVTGLPCLLVACVVFGGGFQLLLPRSQ